MLKCKSCGGEYEQLLDDGMEYYHVCSPIKISENVYEERPDKRDENVGRFRAGKGIEAAVIEI